MSHETAVQEAILNHLDYIERTGDLILYGMMAMCFIAFGLLVFVIMDSRKNNLEK